MDRIPNIRCSSCGAIIGNKFIQFDRLVECNSTKLEAFQALDIKGYCCRKDLANPIILSNKVDSSPSSSKKKTPEIRSKLDPSGESVRIEISGNNLNKLTSSIGREVPVVSLSHSENLDEDYLESLRTELKISLNSPVIKDIPFSKKEIDLELVFESSVLSKKTIVGVDSGYEVIRENRTYEAN